MDYRIEHFEKFNDERGQLVIFLKSGDLANNQKQFGQIYFVTFAKKGVVRAKHYHKKMREWFGMVSGKLELILVDVKTKEKKEMVLNADSSRYLRIEIGP